MGNRKRTLLLLLIPIILIMFVIRSTWQDTPVKNFAISDTTSIDVFVEGTNYYPVLKEKSWLFFNKKTRLSSIYRNNSSVYFDYNIVDVGGFKMAIGSVQDDDVEKVVFQTPTVKVEQNVGMDKLFLAAIPIDLQKSSSSMGHPLLIMKDSEEAGYPYTRR